MKRAETAQSRFHHAFQELVNFSYQVTRLNMTCVSTITQCCCWRALGALQHLGEVFVEAALAHHSCCFTTTTSCIVPQPQATRRASTMKPQGRGLILQSLFVSKTALSLAEFMYASKPRIPKLEGTHEDH